MPADAGSRTSTAPYGYGPSGSAYRVQLAKHFLDCNPLTVKTVSVLQRPVKPPSSKNAENLDVQHQRDKAAFQRRANVYQRHAHRPYHHHAPAGSILTTFEKGHIVDRGRRKVTQHEARGVYDPVMHEYRIDPSPEVAAATVAEAAKERPSSAPHRRESAAPEPHHKRSTTPFEHKYLQVTRGTYNPLTHEYIDQPEADYAQRKEKEFERRHGLGAMRRVQPQTSCDPILWNRDVSVQTSESTQEASTASAVEGSSASSAPATRRQRPTSAPTARSRRAVAGRGVYNPLTHQWNMPPANPDHEKADEVAQRRMGISGKGVGRTCTPGQQGVYNPILNTWTVLPANPRLIDGLAFMPATLFSKPTPATIRM
ncbi:hypothetical protein VOLCADRAFT_91852 [Volvox carteri f. nagariensis]|uniref:Uncharacterized protein n=1 Tax=Volvox carteri f. nagariensis TaxID=3068 RepID=D8TY47_VOLCA|nr:uncharacterized protein VOLCADRAFT_91852 [Volvox carteri f. nagariensis]EFJ47582.1 hypothetical protein VOLCADRAFT_91852 [Volvox carteri f. nagariensis]|eukprot:XP_002951406.1 hypothetical protein VOLCADRAFT_91852 [Volvox carteri f. nagariensis]